MTQRSAISPDETDEIVTGQQEAAGKGENPDEEEEVKKEEPAGAEKALTKSERNEVERRKALMAKVLAMQTKAKGKKETKE
jgi:hypothetical protein